MAGRPSARRSRPRVFGPYYQREAVFVPLSNDLLVVFGSPSRTHCSLDGAADRGCRRGRSGGDRAGLAGQAARRRARAPPRRAEPRPDRRRPHPRGDAARRRVGARRALLRPRRRSTSPSSDAVETAAAGVGREARRQDSSSRRCGSSTPRRPGSPPASRTRRSSRRPHPLERLRRHVALRAADRDAAVRRARAHAHRGAAARVHLALPRGRAPPRRVGRAAPPLRADAARARGPARPRRPRRRIDPLTQAAEPPGVGGAARRTAVMRRPAGVIVLDVDGLKGGNDERGHHLGDEYLQLVADSRRRRACARTTSSRGVGGDEFAVLLPGADEPPVHAVAKRVADALAGHPGLAGFRLAASVGYAATPPAASIAHAQRLADEGMYRDEAASARRDVARRPRPATEEEARSLRRSRRRSSNPETTASAPEREQHACQIPASAGWRTSANTAIAVTPIVLGMQASRAASHAGSRSRRAGRAPTPARSGTGCGSTGRGQARSGRRRRARRRGPPSGRPRRGRRRLRSRPHRGRCGPRRPRRRGRSPRES